MPTEQDFLGRGWSFPPQFGADEAGVRMVSGKEDIEQSLHLLLSTSLGERVQRPKYGCNLADYQFEAINSAFIGLLRDLVDTAILYHEPRIRVDRIDINTANQLAAIEGKILISIDYRIRTSNSRYNFVFPFYQNEGAQDQL